MQTYTIGEVARRAGVIEHHLRQLVRKGLVPFVKVGRFHGFRLEDLEVIREAARKAGYLPPSEVPPHAQV